MKYMIGKIYRKILIAISCSTVFFIFQACYGTPRDIDSDVNIEGIIKSENSGKPLSGIKVTIGNNSEYTISDVEGKFKLYTSRSSQYPLKFEDSDTKRERTFITKDTIINSINETVYLKVFLKE